MNETRYERKDGEYFKSINEAANYWDQLLHSNKCENCFPSEIKFRFKTKKEKRFYHKLFLLEPVGQTMICTMPVTSFVRIVYGGLHVEVLEDPKCWVGTLERHTNAYYDANPVRDSLGSTQLFVEGLGFYNFIEISPMDIISMTFKQDDGPQ